MDLIEQELTLIDKRLKEIIKSAGPEIQVIGDYIFNGTGKRIRPTLFLVAAYRNEKNLLHLIEAAVAFELMHTASLLHDDVIDQADLRRGKEAVHVKWSNKIAILSGDYLLSRAFDLLVSYKNHSLMNIVVNIVRNMSEGEVEQAFANTAMADLEERYFSWIGKKSASFFAGCCEAGSLLGGDGPEEQMLWSEYGYNLGIAFQLIDDLLDYTGEGSATGKPLYGDLCNRVVTLPLIRTIKQQSEEETISKFIEDNRTCGSQVGVVARTVLDGDGPAYTYKKAEEYAAKAAGLSRQLSSEHNYKAAVLEQLARDLLLRKK
ncbi:MAG: polyprenyl synthetase family protein [Bacillota bacterium]